MTWEEYKELLRNGSPEGRALMEEVEEEERIIDAIIEQRKKIGITQRELAELSHMSQSTIARIESYAVTPNLDTLRIILKNLGLTLKVQPKEKAIG